MSEAPSGLEAEAIRQTILADAKKEAEKIVRDAQAEAKKITRDAHQRAQDNLTGWDARQRQMAQGVGDRVLGKARNDAHMLVLDAKAQLITEAFNQARKYFQKERGKAQYKTLLKNLIINAGTQIGGGTLFAFARKEDQSIITKITGLDTAISKASGNKTKVTVGKKSIDTLGGVFIQNKEGNITVDYRLETLLKQVELQRRSDIAVLLFGEEAKE